MKNPKVGELARYYTVDGNYYQGVITAVDDDIVTLDDHNDWHRKSLTRVKKINVRDNLAVAIKALRCIYSTGRVDDASIAADALDLIDKMEKKK